MPTALQAQKMTFPALQIRVPAGLSMATLLAAILACALAAPVLLQPQADRGPNLPVSPEAAVEAGTGPTLADPARRSRCTAVLRESAALRRSLSRCADSFAASEARAGTLARRFRASNRRADRLVRENAELRARLEATPGCSPETVRALAGSIPAIRPAAVWVNGNLRTAPYRPEPMHQAYPPPLPLSGTWARAQRCIT
jgi:hypothetical protein